VVVIEVNRQQNQRNGMLARTESLGWIAARDLNELFGKNITKLQIPAF